MMCFIDVHTHNTEAYQKTDETFIAITNYQPNETILTDTYFSVGIHPWFLNEKTIEIELELIKIHFNNSNCLAIGECGLDLVCTTDFDLQQQVFIRQIRLAVQYQKPLIIHCVKAHQQLIEIIKNEPINIPLILHGFSKKQAVHRQLLQIPNLYFSFGKSMLKSITSRQNIEDTPIERLFIETDNSLEDIKTLYIEVAEIKNIPLESLKKQVFLNFQKIF